MQMGPIDGVCHGVRSTTTPHRLEYFLSNTFQQQSGGSGGTEGGLNMKGKMIWKRKEKWIYDEEGLLSLGWLKASQEEE